MARTRVLLSLVCCVGLAARAQTAPPGATTPPIVSATPADAPSATGGVVLVSTEVLAGLVTGGLIGSGSAAPTWREKNESIYFGSIGAGLLLGTAAGVYQHFVPVHTTEGWLTSVGAIAGAFAGYSVADGFRLAPGPATMWSIAVGTQVGVILPLALTAGGGALSGSDFWTITLGALHGTIITMMACGIATGRLDSAPSLLSLSPALGMGLGAALAAAFETRVGKVLLMGLPPLGIAWTGFLMGYAVTKENVRLASVTGLLGLAISMTFFALLAPSDTPERGPERVSLPNWMPIPTVVVSPLGRAGPGFGLVRAF
ncbi:MAG: hypothetical protein ACT4TC_20305 [Myxococcaceae bacterium]